MWAQIASVAPEDGKSYVVAAYVNSKYYALPATTSNGSTLSGVEITLNKLNKVNISVASGKTWTLEKGTGDNASYYNLKYTEDENTYYLYKNGTGKTNYNFKVSTDYYNYWSFTTNGTGYTVTAIDRGTNNTVIQCNSGTFRCYSEATPIILLEIGDAPASSVTAPSIDLPEGTYFSAQSVTITTNEAGGTTYYTTDGSNPTDESTEYTGAIPVSKTTTIKAITYKEGESSEVVSATYTIITPKSIPYQETFNDADGTGGNDGEWSGSIASNNYSNSDWTFTNVKGADKCIKASTGSAIGSLTSPWIAFENGKTYTILLRAGAWVGDATVLKISYNGGDAIQASQSLTQGAFVNYAYTINPTGPAQIKIESTGKKRYFIDDFMIVEGNAKGVTISSATWASFSSSSALDFTGTAVTPYIAKYKDASNVTLLPIAKVPAETGIVVYASEGTYAIPVLTDAADETTGNLLKPWLTAGEPDDATYYTLAVDNMTDKNPVFKGSEGGTLAAGKAYLVMPGGSPAPSLGVDFEGATSITTTNFTNGTNNSGAIFNLNGQRVTQPTKGLYIVNGKKYVVK